MNSMCRACRGRKMVTQGKTNGLNWRPVTSALADRRVQADLALGILLGELVVDGRDVAAAPGGLADRPGSCRPDRRRFHPILPGWIRPDRTAGLTEVRPPGRGHDLV